MGVADLWTAVSDPVGGDLIVDSDIERLLRRVVTDVFDDDIGAVHSGDPQTAEAHLTNVTTVAGADPRRAQLRLTHEFTRGLFRARPVCPVSVDDREWKMGRHGSSTSYP